LRAGENIRLRGGPVCEHQGVSFLDRIRGYWKIAPSIDHPLSERERHEDHSATAYDERARTTEEFVGPDLDPDEPRSGTTD
jgi:hypothetical protein